MEEGFERFLSEHEKRAKAIVDKYIAEYQNSTDERILLNLVHHMADNLDYLVSDLEESGNEVIGNIQPMNPTPDQVYNIQEINEAARVKWGASLLKNLNEIENS